MERPKAIYRDGFRYDGTFTSSTGIAIESPEKLREMCRQRPSSRPSLSKDGRRASTASTGSEPSHQRLTREFIIAQHKFYGVPILWKRRDACVNIFRRLVLEGKVRKPPASTRCIAPTPSPSTQPVFRCLRDANPQLQFYRMPRHVRKLEATMAQEWKQQCAAAGIDAKESTQTNDAMIRGLRTPSEQPEVPEDRGLQLP